MDEKLFILCFCFGKRYPVLQRNIPILMKIATLLIMLSYFFFIGKLIFFQNIFILKFVLVPAFVFFIVSIVRKWLNCSRPFEKLDIQITLKHGKGKSFPSRHTASAFIISMAILSVCFPWGIFCLMLSVFIGLLRIIGGVHYPSDVMAGAIYSILIGYIAFFI